MYGLNKREMGLFKTLDTPKKIQDFLNKLEKNFEEHGDTFMSPRRVLREKKCQCIEGAILGALILRVHGFKPLVVDLRANSRDLDHVIAVFKQQGKWGAISKTNHNVLRYREPIYNTIRELVMSYFHEYFDDFRRKNLRSYSMPVDLSIFDSSGWVASEEDLWYIYEHLDNAKHYPILNKKQLASLRKADEIEIEAGKLEEWSKAKTRKGKQNKNSRTKKNSFLVRNI